MKTSKFRRYCHLAAVALLLGGLIVGCSKKPAATPAATVPAPADAPAVVSAPAAMPPVRDAAAVGDRVAQAQAALQAKDYQKAVTAMSVPPQSLVGMNADQLAAYNSAKSSLAQQVIGAAADGDPQAIAAMDILRQNALHHQ